MLGVCLYGKCYRDRVGNRLYILPVVSSWQFKGFLLCIQPVMFNKWCRWRVQVRKTLDC